METELSASNLVSKGFSGSVQLTSKNNYLNYTKNDLAEILQLQDISHHRYLIYRDT